MGIRRGLQSSSETGGGLGAGRLGRPWKSSSRSGSTKQPPSGDGASTGDEGWLSVRELHLREQGFSMRRSVGPAIARQSVRKRGTRAQPCRPSVRRLGAERASIAPNRRRFAAARMRSTRHPGLLTSDAGYARATWLSVRECHPTSQDGLHAAIRPTSCDADD